jgi:hypothetical protein
MIPIVIAAFWFVYAVAPVLATQADAFDPDQPFEQALNTGILRSLLNQALDRLASISPPKVGSTLLPNPASTIGISSSNGRRIAHRNRLRS